MDAVRVAKYLATTSGMGLVLGGTRPIELTGLCDSSYADDVETRRSTQGYCFILGAGICQPVSLGGYGRTDPLLKQALLSQWPVSLGGYGRTDPLLKQALLSQWSSGWDSDRIVSWRSTRSS
ncbi:unnamed protein product [Closterium sp. NIES-54]